MNESLVSNLTDKLNIESLDNNENDQGSILLKIIEKVKQNPLTSNLPVA